MSQHIRVNPIACEAHGMCAELLPEMITLDEWGYPILDGRPLPPELLDHARRAAEACPTFALLIERRSPPPHAGAAGRAGGSGVRNVRRRTPRQPHEPRA
jgi:ferredoxin